MALSLGQLLIQDDAGFEEALSELAEDVHSDTEVLIIVGIMIIGFIILSAALVAAVIFNRLVRYRALMREALSGIEVQLKRRHDLIPNVVETVKGHMRYESGLFEHIASIRSSIVSGGTVKDKNSTESAVTTVFKTVFALAESYPELKADKSFLGLQDKLSDAEDQIQLARRYYNGAVRDYNITVESFPGNLVSGIFGFKPADFFEIEYATERKAPDVKFNPE